MTWNTREEMKKKLDVWPVRGKIIEVAETYDPDLKKPVPMLIDEYGNQWMGDECLTYPPKLPISWADFQKNMQELMKCSGLDPDLLEKYERLYNHGTDDY